MRLKSFRVQNFRSVVDSGLIEATDIMVLVGSNQSGKTSILRGLYSISLTHKYDEQNELTQLNNINKKFADGDLQSQDLPIITATFLLQEDDRKNLREKFPAPQPTQTSAPAGDAPNPPTTNAEADHFSASISTVLDSLEDIEITKFIDGSYSVKLANEAVIFTNPLMQINKIKELFIKLKRDVQPDFTRDQNIPLKDKFDKLYEEFLLKETHELLPKESFTGPLQKFKDGASIDAPLKKKLDAAFKELQT